MMDRPIVRHYPVTSPRDDFGAVVPVRNVGCRRGVWRDARRDRVVTNGKVILDQVVPEHEALLSPVYWCTGDATA
jgi:hypothetical protein